MPTSLMKLVLRLFATVHAAFAASFVVLVEPEAMQQAKGEDSKLD